MQAIYAKIFKILKKIKVDPNDKRPEDIKKAECENLKNDVIDTTKEILALAFLKEDMIISEFENLKIRIQERKPKVFELLNDAKFWDEYFEGYWIKRITPRGFCVFGLIQRTNNITESKNFLMNRKMGVKQVVCDYLCK